MSSTSVLVIEDNEFHARMISKMFDAGGHGQFLVTWAAQLITGIEELKTKAFDVVILDLNLPDSVGLATFSALQKEFPNIPIIIWTAEEDVELAVLAVSQGAQDYIVKGHISAHFLIRILRYAIERKRAEQNFRQLMDIAPIGIVLTDKTGHIVDANAEILRTFSYERKELIGESIEILVPETLRATHEKHRASYETCPHVRPMGIGVDLVARRRTERNSPWRSP